MRINVKPLTHWIIYKGYRVRFKHRDAERAEGILTTLDGAEIPFIYYAAEGAVHLPGVRVRINEHGWELEHSRDERSADE